MCLESGKQWCNFLFVGTKDKLFAANFGTFDVVEMALYVTEKSMICLVVAIPVQINWTHHDTARTARFSKKSPWSVFFRGEMSVTCHKITVKSR